ncbi:MAG: hypothetical protein MZW92_15450 [Comamonadaceae bacterium]|nr:hypothetical protein [Comamonadaceae bacterium]
MIRDHGRDLLERGPGHLPLRHLRRRGLLGRHAQAASGHRRRRPGRRGAGVSPRTALAVGLKVDAEALPAPLLANLGPGASISTRPPRRWRLLKLDAVVGVKGYLRRRRARSSPIGITCALCHSNVDDRVAPGIGRRLDGWANRDLNVGAIVGLAPDLDRGGAACWASTRRRVRAVLGELGAGALRRRAVPRRQGLPSRRQDRAPR